MCFLSDFFLQIITFTSSLRKLVFPPTSKSLFRYDYPDLGFNFRSSTTSAHRPPSTTKQQLKLKRVSQAPTMCFTPCCRDILVTDGRAHHPQCPMAYLHLRNRQTRNVIPPPPQPSNKPTTPPLPTVQEETKASPRTRPSPGTLLPDSPTLGWPQRYVHRRRGALGLDGQNTPARLLESIDAVVLQQTPRAAEVVRAPRADGTVPASLSLQGDGAVKEGQVLDGKAEILPSSVFTPSASSKSSTSAVTGSEQGGVDKNGNSAS